MIFFKDVTFCLFYSFSVNAYRFLIDFCFLFDSKLNLNCHNLLSEAFSLFGIWISKVFLLKINYIFHKFFYLI